MGDWYQRADGTWSYDSDAPQVDPTPTGLVPIVSAPDVLAPPEQDDLSHLDEVEGELINTAKVTALDVVLVQPPQDPEWRPQ